MTRRAELRLSRAELRASVGVLLISRELAPAALPALGQPATVAANPAEGAEP